MTRDDRQSGIPPLSRRGGFSQIEVLIAMLIVGLATPFLMGGVMGGLSQARHSQDRGAATAWAEGELDFVRGQCYLQLRPSVRKVTQATAEPGELPPPDGFSAGQVRLEEAGPGLLRATVSLYRHDWTGPAPGEAPSMAVSTYIADVRVAGLCP